jgi:predicted TIM-barrel fold metal-dependent hydrolase
MGSQLRLLEILGWKPPFGLSLAEQAVEDLMGNNAARLLGIT